MEMIEFTIICALLLWIWYSGGFSKKNQKSVIPVLIGKCYPGCVCHLSLTNPSVTEDFIPVVLPTVHENIVGENTVNISSNTIEMNEVENSETVPEVLTPLPHSPHDAEAAMENPLPESHSPKRFTFEVTKLPYLPDGFYITLRLNERHNGKMKKKLK